MTENKQQQQRSHLDLMKTSEWRTELDQPFPVVYPGRGKWKWKWWVPHFFSPLWGALIQHILQIQSWASRNLALPGEISIIITVIISLSCNISVWNTILLWDEMREELAPFFSWFYGWSPPSAGDLRDWNNFTSCNLTAEKLHDVTNSWVHLFLVMHVHSFS